MTVLVSPEHLRERFTRYLRTHTFDGVLMRDALARYQELGQVAVFGGFARDMAISGAVGFRSDIDVVIKCGAEHLDDVIARLPESISVSRNKFGGYRLHDRNSLLDVWALETTWAVREGYAAATLEELPKTTFFNWDAIAYCLSTRELLCGAAYFEDVKGRFLDLNLPDNPNPRAMCVRALRFARRAPTRLSRSLVGYILEYGADPEALTAYSVGGLAGEFVDTCLSRMERFMRSHVNEFTYEDQMPLPFPEVTSSTVDLQVPSARIEPRGNRRRSPTAGDAR